MNLTFGVKDCNCNVEELRKVKLNRLESFRSNQKKGETVLVLSFNLEKLG